MKNGRHDERDAADQESPEAQQASELIARVRQGGSAALDTLVSFIYPELKRRAHWMMSKERDGHTFGPSGSELVQRVLEKILNSGGQVFNAANTEDELIRMLTQQMRFILVDYARASRTRGKPSPRSRVPFENIEGWARAAEVNIEEVLTIHEILNELQREDPAAALALELRVFGGLTNEQAARAMSLSVPKFRRTLACGTVFVRQALSSGHDDRGPSGNG